MTRTLRYYYAKRNGGFCVNCGRPKGTATGVQCADCAARSWNKWKPGSRGRPPLTASLQPCVVCQKKNASDGATCGVCKARLNKMRTWKGLPALKRLMELL